MIILHSRKLQRWAVSLVFAAASVIPVPSGAAGPLLLPTPGTMVSLSASYTPAQMVGLAVYPDHPLKFDVLVRKDDRPLTLMEKRQEYTMLIKYFLASLTVPDADQWVNLSPFERNRIIPPTLGGTVMGRDLLVADYLLKQVMSSLSYPESGLGKSFWERVFAEAGQKYPTANVPVDIYNKVWIVPDRAVVYEHGTKAYVLQSHLKVMLEEDYLSTWKHRQGAVRKMEPSETVSRRLMRQMILPILEREINEGEIFARLRQIVQSMVLATWYKQALRKTILGQVYADRARTAGLEPRDRGPEVRAIYERYVEAYKKGVYNYVREETSGGQVIPRKYFSGGFFRNPASLVIVHDRAQAINDSVFRSAAGTFVPELLEQASFVLRGAQDKAMSASGRPDEQPSDRFVHAMETLSKTLYPSNASRRAEFNNFFGLFLDDLDPLVGDRIHEEAFYEMGYRFQAIFESELLMDLPIGQYALEFLNDDIKRKRARFINSEGVIVDAIMGGFTRHLIAGYYLVKLQRVGARDERGAYIKVSRRFEGRAGRIVNLLSTIWSKALAPRYWLMSKETGYFHESADIGSHSWKQVAELLTYLYNVRNQENVRILLDTLDDISNKEDERELPRNLELIVPKILMALIPRMIGRPIIPPVPAMPADIKRVHARRIDLQHLIAEVNDVLRAHDPRTIRVGEYRRQAAEIINDLFVNVGPQGFYGDTYFSFDRYSWDGMWSLMQNLTAAKLALSAEDFMRIHGDAPHDIPVMVQFYLENSSDFAMLARFPASRRATPAKDLSAVKGGIDLNAAGLQLSVRHDSQGVPLPWKMQDVARYRRLTGLLPQVIDIQPAAAMTAFEVPLPITREISATVGGKPWKEAL